MKICSRKSQITVFIILGIIIVISMGLLFAVNIKNEFSVPLYDIKVKEYITGCLERVADEGLYLIGRQGGVLYDDQIKKGSILSSRFDYGMFVLKYNTDNVSYGIKRSEIGDGTYMLKPLCNPITKNKYNLLEYEYSCETYEYNIINPGQNIQDYLKEYVNESMVKKDKCDIELLREYGYKIDKENIKTEVLIGDDDLMIELDYPLIIKVGDKSKTKLLKFSYNPRIRLKKIHELASHLIGFKSLEEVNPLVGDIYNIDFDIVNEAGSNKLRCRTGSCLLEGMEVKKIKNVYGYDDILQIIDNKSILYGKPYVFQFAIENRPPDLEDAADVNIGINEPFIIELVFHDPDEDTPSYSSSGCEGKLVNQKFTNLGFVAEAKANVGECELTIKACDEGNLCDSKILTIIVQ